jgi:hypothetical protein
MSVSVDSRQTVLPGETVLVGTMYAPRTSATPRLMEDNDSALWWLHLERNRCPLQCAGSGKRGSGSRSGVPILPCTCTHTRKGSGDRQGDAARNWARACEHSRYLDKQKAKLGGQRDCR